jgi:myo-inositol-1(or 4)-monophosphatase
MVCRSTRRNDQLRASFAVLLHVHRLLRHGGVGIGVVHDPLRDDLFVAVRGEGATRNGGRLVVSEQRSLRTGVLSTQVQSDDPVVLDRYAARLRSFLSVARAVRSLGAPALALAYVSCGWLDAFCEDDMNPWDTLAGTLLIEEAGGRATTFDGAPRPLDHRADILASNGHLHEQLIGILNDNGTLNNNPNSTPVGTAAAGRQAT